MARTGPSRVTRAFPCTCATWRWNAPASTRRPYSSSRLSHRSGSTPPRSAGGSAYANFPRTDPDRGLPLVSREREGPLVCTRCGYTEESGPCVECGSSRMRQTGLGVERVRDELSEVLGVRVGLITAEGQDNADAPVVVGTAPPILEGEWDAVILPDADAFLAGNGLGAVERAFRLFYGSAEVARKLLLIQTHVPEHYALRAAVRGDYEAFAAAELPRL